MAASWAWTCDEGLTVTSVGCSVRQGEIDKVEEGVTEASVDERRIVRCRRWSSA